MEINRDFISQQNINGIGNHPIYIVIHETDNTSKGAGAATHAKAQHDGNFSNMSVHYYCGSDGIYQAAEHTCKCWHIGKDYGGGHSITDATNNNTIGIEICVNSDGDYMVARENAIHLVRYLMPILKLGADKVIRHNDAKGKYCPRKMMDTPSLWEDFKEAIASKSIKTDPIQTSSMKVATAGDTLNIRSYPENGTILDKYQDKTQIRATKKTEVDKAVWFHTEKGWISASYVEGWLLEDNNWYYIEKGYKNVKSRWKKVGEKWYYFNESGVMVTGWMVENGKKYYLASSGVMAIGWKQIKTEWYYFDQNGAMKTGWIKDADNWYYLKENGVMAAECWVFWKEKWYYLKESGKMASNEWTKLDGKWYYLKDSGVMASDQILRVGGEKYSIAEDGHMEYTDSSGKLK